jgi:hypothetical protein
VEELFDLGTSQPHHLGVLACPMQFYTDTYGSQVPTSYEKYISSSYLRKVPCHVKPIIILSVYPQFSTKINRYQLLYAGPTLSKRGEMGPVKSTFFVGVIFPF